LHTLAEGINTSSGRSLLTSGGGGDTATCSGGGVLHPSEANERVMSAVENLVFMGSPPLVKRGG
jgi:hypothetical protein